MPPKIVITMMVGEHGKQVKELLEARNIRILNDFVTLIIAAFDNLDEVNLFNKEAGSIITIKNLVTQAPVHPS